MARLTIKPDGGVVVLEIHRYVRFAVCALTLVLLAACGGSTPTQPSFDIPSGGSLTGQSVISGVVVGGGGGFAAEGFAPAAVSTANLQVSVEGTSIRATTDSQGNFRLVNVPSGNRQVRFAGSDVNAMVTVPAVGQTQQIELQVQLQSASATIVTDNRAQLDRFEGLAVSVAVVGIVGGTVTLDDGTIVDVDDVTWWDTGGDYFNITDLAAAVAAGLPVDIKGQGTLNPISGRILASVIRAKLGAARFEGVVAAASGVDPDGTILLVANSKGLITDIRVDAATVWDAGGDVFNLTDLIAAVAGGFIATAEGNGSADATGTFITAAAIKVELEEAPFKGTVASASGVDPDGTILLVFNQKGTITDIRVDAATIWRGGSIPSLTALLAALAGPDPVEVDGDGFTGGNRTFILATEIKAEIDSGTGGGGGCAAGQSFATEIAMVQTLILDTQTIAQANGLNGGQTNSLVSKLQNTIKDLEKCKSNAPANKLGAFINQVQAFVKSGKLIAADGDTLIAGAQAIITAINGAS